MAKKPEKEFLLTLFVTERVCTTIKAQTLSEAKEKLLEAYMNGELNGIETRDVYEGNLYQFAEPTEANEWLGILVALKDLTRNLAGAYAKTRKVK